MLITTAAEGILIFFFFFFGGGGGGHFSGKIQVGISCELSAQQTSQIDKSDEISSHILSEK